MRKMFMTFIKSLLLLVITATSGSSLQFLNCNWVNSLDCTNYPSGVKCGTNGVTYSNNCYLAKAQCQDKQMRTLHEGPCLSSEAKSTTIRLLIASTISQRPTTAVGTTTRRPITTLPPTSTRPTTVQSSSSTTTGPTSDPLHVICDTMSNVHCVNDIEPICGSNGRTYINACEFHIEVCKQHDLTIKHRGFC